jgi:hypothetical protein
MNEVLNFHSFCPWCGHQVAGLVEFSAIAFMSFSLIDLLAIDMQFSFEITKECVQFVAQREKYNSGSDFREILSNLT